MVLCNDATYSGDFQTGDPTEVALVAAGADQSLDKKVLEEEHPRLTDLHPPPARGKNGGAGLRRCCRYTFFG